MLLNWQAWHPILFEGLTHFDDDYDAECWGCAGPRLFGRLIPKYASAAGPRMLFPVNYREVSKTFETHDQMLLDCIDNESVGFHLYGKVIGQLPVHSHSIVVDLFARNQLFEDDLTRKVFRCGEFQSPIRRTFTDRFIRELCDPARWSLSPGCRRGDGRTGAPEGGFRPDLPNIAACLLSYKRIQQLPQVLKSIASHPAMERIVVMNNNPEAVLDPSEFEELIMSSRSTWSGRAPLLPHLRGGVQLQRARDPPVPRPLPRVPLEPWRRVLPRRDTSWIRGNVRCELWALQLCCTVL